MAARPPAWGGGGGTRRGLRPRLARREVVFGPLVTEHRAPAVASMLAAAGFDFLVIDAEHSAFSPETAGDFIRAARGAGIAPLVRVTDRQGHFIARPLDAGAHGVLVPRVVSADDARGRWRRPSRRGPTGRSCWPCPLAAADAVVRACRAAGLAPGISVFDAARAGFWLRRGFRFLMTSNHVAMLQGAAREMVARVRAAMAAGRPGAGPRGGDAPGPGGRSHRRRTSAWP